MRKGRIIANRYRLEQPLASGGMGTVWVAEHTQLGIQVAVKFMDPELTSEPDLRSRFEREAKSAAGLQSPHVIQIHDYGMDGDVPFIAMELLRGEDLEMRLARSGGRLPLDEVVKVVLHTCKALRAAHDAGIVHRDLKPGNIFITKDGDDELFKVLDFGIAKDTSFGISSKHDTSAAELLGSPAYISPEQIRRARAVERSTDLWSLAVIAYEACTGALPFDSEDAGDILAKILTESATPPTQIHAELPAALDAFFARALDRDVDARFATARELARAFCEACGVDTRGNRATHPELSGPWPSLSQPGTTSAEDDAQIQVEGVHATTLVLDDADSLAVSDRKAPPEAFRTDAPRSVDIATSRATTSRSSVAWLSVALLGVGILLFIVARQQPTDVPAAAGTPEPSPNVATVPVESAGSAPAPSAAPSSSATQALASSTQPPPADAPPPPASAPALPRVPVRPKPKSEVLGF